MDHPALEGGQILGTQADKVVTIAEPEGNYTIAAPTTVASDGGKSPKQFPVGLGRHPNRRPPINASSTSLAGQNTATLSSRSDLLSPGHELPGGAQHSHYHHGDSTHVLSQVLEWLSVEKAKRKKRSKAAAPSSTDEVVYDKTANTSTRSSTELSDADLALERLERILALDQDAVMPIEETSHLSKRKSSPRRLRKNSTAASSDTEYQDGDAIVPSVDAILDNSKTMGYTGGSASSTELKTHAKQDAKDKEGWLIFKNEIVRLAHTLRLKGWRRVPLNAGADIGVERLSGALTNAVYVVSPPKQFTEASATNSSTSLSLKKPPPKLLLRVYGPQVEHLIDRESELQILRRLARKKIGPRLLGTFINGRFEEFFNARTLTAQDLRVPETSKQIAKRMRELHDGVELLEKERDDGPFVWQNWDKWVARCEDVICWLDNQVLSGKAGKSRSKADAWKQRGLVCGVEWPVFRKTVDRYRKWLVDQYGGKSSIRQKLVFAHNDAQYGNLLRLIPVGESPFLLPLNEHKQLVVIDFEYASANLPGLEFANHFTEWCYNYHDPEKSYACNTAAYPTPEEQQRFLKSYLTHRPQFHPQASVTPKSPASPEPSSSVASFILDSHTPPAQFAEEEKQRELATEDEIKRLMHESRLWRVANSAQWVAWGIVQAKVEGMDEALDKSKAKPTHSEHHIGEAPLSDFISPGTSDATLAAHGKRQEGLVAGAQRDGAQMDGENDDEEEFDYLAYAQDRAMFFWGDVLGLGLVEKESLPTEMLAKVKIVEY